MANLTSWHEAKQKMESLQRTMTECQRQLKEIEGHVAEFVDNPQNPINVQENITDTSILYIPTLSDRKHYPMKKKTLIGILMKFICLYTLLMNIVVSYLIVY